MGDILDNLGDEDDDMGGERELDYSEMTQREIQDLIDDALDRGDFDTVEELHKYLK